MLDLQKAKILVNRYLKKRSEGLRFELSVIDEATVEKDCGWVFCYQTKPFVETRKHFYRMTGCVPLVVDKHDGTLDYFDGAYLARLNKTLPKYFDLEWFYQHFLGNSSFRGPSDKYAVERYVSFTVPISGYRVIEQANQQLEETPFTWQKINELATRSFENEAEAKSWLQTIIKLMEAALLSENSFNASTKGDKRSI